MQIHSCKIQGCVDTIHALCASCPGRKMDLKNVLFTALIQAISCQDVTLTILQPRTTVGSLVELVCEMPGQGWRSDWNRDVQLVLTVTKTRETPCGVEWHIDTPANTEVICQENSGRFLLKFYQSTIEMNGTIWDCRIDGSAGSNSVTIAVTEKKKVEPKVNVFKKPNALDDGGNITLTCNVSGVINATYITWSQYWKDKLIRKVKAPFSSLHQFSIYGATYADEGNYTCNVTALDPNEGKIFISGSVEIQIHGPPVFKRPDDRIMSALPGQDVTLSFKYLSSASNANHTFLHNGVPQSTPSLRTSVEVTFLVHSVTLEREGFMVNFTVNNVTDLQLGTYSIKTCNDFGCATSYPVQLRVSDPASPATPNKMVSTFLIPLSVIMGCVLLAAVVAAIIITLRKRSHRKLHVNGAPKPDDSKDTAPKGRNLSLVAQNDLYETSRRIDDDDVADCPADDASFRGSVLVMQENELYEKSDEGLTVQIMDTADIYSEVRKT